MFSYPESDHIFSHFLGTYLVYILCLIVCGNYQLTSKRGGCRNLLSIDSRLNRIDPSTNVKISVLRKKYDQVEVTSVFPERTFSKKIPTQKDGSSSILETLTNGSHQVNLKSMYDPYCFKNIVWDETGRWLLIVNISYKPLSYWRILIHYEGLPRQFSHLKKLRSLVDPSRVYNIYIYISR